MSRKTQDKAVLDEFAKVDCKVVVWLLVKDGKIAGKITAREGGRDTSHVAFVLFNDGLKPAVYGYRRMTGAGYPRISSGIADILRANRKELQEHGVFIRDHWDLMNTWEKDLQDSGFLVLSTI